MKKLAIYALLFGQLSLAHAQLTGILARDSKAAGVGFRSFLSYDVSRVPLREQARKHNSEGRVIQVNVWYPAHPQDSKPLTAYDYLLLKALETDTTIPLKKQDSIAKQILATSYNTSVDSIHRLFKNDYLFKAIRDAPFKEKRHPLVVLFHNDPLGFAPLAEALAANGFVVGNFPVTGTSSKKFNWETTAGIQTEMDDLDFVVRLLSKLPIVDSTCIIPAGYSYGAMAALAYQLRNRNVKGVISLDGGIGTLWGGDMVFKMPGFYIENLKKPLFHAWSDFNNPYSDHKWLSNYICCERYLVKFEKLRHGDFVEGLLFEKLMPGFTSKALGVSAGDYYHQFEKLLESLIYFASWIATGDLTFKAQLGMLPLPYEQMSALSCTRH